MYSPEPGVQCVTEELARDCAVVLAVASRIPEWLRPGREVNLSIELPSFAGNTPRLLEYGSVIARSESLRQGLRIWLDIHRRTFLISAGERSSSQSPPACRDCKVTNTSTQFRTIERGKEMLLLKNLVNEESGQDMVEYGLVVALIALIVLAAVATFGTNLTAGFTSMNGKVATSVK
jgi:pilus assembly protein Flp/PilA